LKVSEAVERMISVRHDEQRRHAYLGLVMVDPRRRHLAEANTRSEQVRAWNETAATLTLEQDIVETRGFGFVWFERGCFILFPHKIALGSAVHVISGKDTDGLAASGWSMKQYTRGTMEPWNHVIELLMSIIRLARGRAAIPLSCRQTHQMAPGRIKRMVRACSAASG